MKHTNKCLSLFAGLILSACMLAQNEGGSSLNIKLHFPGDGRAAFDYTEHYAVFITVKGDNGYNHVLTVYSPDKKAIIPGVPIGEKLTINAAVFPVEVPVTTFMPCYGEYTDDTGKALKYETNSYNNSITITLNAKKTNAVGGRYYYINRNYINWDEVHVFIPTDIGTLNDWNIKGDTVTASILVVGGGGGGGNGSATGYGGGGGGGYASYNREYELKKTSEYTIVVGTGGTGGAASGTNGGQSSFTNPDVTDLSIFAGGGGGGGAVSNNGNEALAIAPALDPPNEKIKGGGGGGGSKTGGATAGGIGGEVENGPTRNGGGGVSNASGGGGGTYKLGNVGSNGRGGDSGEGKSYDITGNDISYSNGGGGSGITSGGKGGGVTSGAGANGQTPGSGGSGGKTTGGRGADGVVIVRFPFDLETLKD